jgi:hypothetical protein
MESNFVPYQIAVDMKSIGFDELCFGWYADNGVYNGYSIKNSTIYELNMIKNSCSAPLYQQAFRWFREKYSIYKNINYDWNSEVYIVAIMQQNKDKSCKITHLKEGDYIKDYKTYEEAELECLKKLIEIVKEKKS